MEEPTISQIIGMGNQNMNDVGTRTRNSLEFLFLSIKTVTPLSIENYLTWSTQVFKLFQANAFDQFLDKTIPPPPRFLSVEADSVSPNPNPSYRWWKMVDQILKNDVLFTISPSIPLFLPNLDTSADLWVFLKSRFQFINQLHLHNQLDHLTMKDRSMMQYISDIRGVAYLLAAAESPISDGGLIGYVFKSLPASYQAFETSILTHSETPPLEEFFSLLSCEEFHLENDCGRKMKDPFDVNLSSRRLQGSIVELLPQVKTFCVAVGAVGARIAGIFRMNVKSYLEEHVFAFWLMAAGILVGVVAAFFAM